MRAILIDPFSRSVSVISIDATASAAEIAVGRPFKTEYRYANGDILVGDRHNATGDTRFRDDARGIFAWGRGLIIGDGMTDAVTTAETAVSAFRFQEVYPDPEADYGCDVQPGDVVTVTGPLHTRSSAGGTCVVAQGLPVKLTVERVFYDYETGYRCVGRVADTEMLAAITKEATSDIGPEWYSKNRPSDLTGMERAREALLNWQPDVCFFSERDIVPGTIERPVTDAFRP